MSSPDQIRRQLADNASRRVKVESDISTARGKQSKAQSTAASAQGKAVRATNGPSRRMYQRAAERAQATALAEGRKIADLSKKTPEFSKKEVALSKNLDAALRSVAKADERKREQQARQEQSRVDAARRAEERHRAQETRRDRDRMYARLHETEERLRALVAPPKQESLRILYLTATPEGDLRVDHEIRRVKAAVRAATHRDLIEIEHLPAATAGDLLDGLTRFRPHVLHFSGHANEDMLVLDRDDPEHNEGHEVATDLFQRAIAAVDQPPTLVVLNACESAAQLPGLLTKVPFAIGMSDTVGDVDTIVFATRFYSAVAEGQSVQAALDLARVELALAGLPDVDLPILETTADPSVPLVLPPA